MTGIRTWTAKGPIDPKEFYSYKARKAYDTQPLAIEITELLDTRYQSADRKKGVGNAVRKTLGEKGNNS